MNASRTPLVSSDRLQDSFRRSPAFLAILRDYRVLLATLLAQMRVAIAAGDVRTVVQHVHRVKGTAANYGFPDLSACATLCETRLTESAVDDPVRILRSREFECLIARLEAASEVQG